MEKLNTYLKDKRLTQKEFSKRSGVSESSLSRALSGIKLPSLKDAVLIQKATRGKVKPADWVSL